MNRFPVVCVRAVPDPESGPGPVSVPGYLKLNQIVHLAGDHPLVRTEALRRS